MPLSITEDIKSVSELKKRTHEIFKQAHRTGHPIIVTVNGKPDVVLLDAAVFERKLKIVNLAGLLSEAEADIKKKHTRPARDFLRELKQNAKISR
ncbi:type II toxin-antitoxin system Phd/YefM family antitoxin [candidate division NPL-UPA2 bacterium]|nr:type II toxin-antitoxin system Phd/YefM family antitoxin [candidate division NPL-UPA2 bacterium]